MEARLNNLVHKGLSYGPDTANPRFDVRAVEVTGDRATASTIESWILTIYQGKKYLRTRRIVDRAIDYTLRKYNGRWLIQSSTTPSVAQ